MTPAEQEGHDAAQGLSGRAAATEPDAGSGTGAFRHRRNWLFMALLIGGVGGALAFLPGSLQHLADLVA